MHLPLRLLSFNCITQFLMCLFGWLQWQWADTGIVNKCCLCPFEACWCFQVHTKSCSCKSSYFALRTCRLVVIWAIMYTWSGMDIACDCTQNFQTSNNHNNFCFEELYQQMLAKALAHFFEAKLLLLDVTDFSLKVSIWCFVVSYEILFCVLIIWMVGFEQIQSKYGSAKDSVRFF